MLPVRELSASENAKQDEALATGVSPDSENGAQKAKAFEAFSDKSVLCALECLLFVAGEPVPAERLAFVLGCESTDIPRLCEQLNEHLQGHGLHVVPLAGGYTLATRPEYADYVQKLLEPEPEKLSIQALETLAIIAYRQPITRPEIDALRGVNSAAIVTSLLEKGLIRIKGRKDAPGRPFLFETTPRFLSCFGLADLSELPRVDLPDIGDTASQSKLLGESLEELSAAQEDEDKSSPSA